MTGSIESVVSKVRMPNGDFSQLNGGRTMLMCAMMGIDQFGSPIDAYPMRELSRLTSSDDADWSEARSFMSQK